MAQANLENAPLSKDLLAEVKERNKLIGMADGHVQYASMRNSYFIAGMEKGIGKAMGFGTGVPGQFKGFASQEELTEALNKAGYEGDTTDFDRIDEWYENKNKGGLTANYKQTKDGIVPVGGMYQTYYQKSGKPLAGYGGGGTKGFMGAGKRKGANRKYDDSGLEWSVYTGEAMRQGNTINKDKTIQSHGLASALGGPGGANIVKHNQNGWSNYGFRPAAKHAGILPGKKNPLNRNRPRDDPEANKDAEWREKAGGQVTSGKKAAGQNVHLRSGQNPMAARAEGYSVTSSAKGHVRTPYGASKAAFLFG